MQQHTGCTDSLLKTALLSAAAHRLYRQPVEDSVCVRAVTTFHPLALNHEKPLLEQKNYGQNCVRKIDVYFRENKLIFYLTERKLDETTIDTESGQCPKFLIS
jgi:hypothetical protein